MEYIRKVGKVLIVSFLVLYKIFSIRYISYLVYTIGPEKNAGTWGMKLWSRDGRNGPDCAVSGSILGQLWSAELVNFAPYCLIISLVFTYLL